MVRPIRRRRNRCRVKTETCSPRAGPGARRAPRAGPAARWRECVEVTKFIQLYSKDNNPTVAECPGQSTN